MLNVDVLRRLQGHKDEPRWIIPIRSLDFMQPKQKASILCLQKARQHPTDVTIALHNVARAPCRHRPNPLTWGGGGGGWTNGMEWNGME